MDLHQLNDGWISKKITTKTMDKEELYLQHLAHDIIHLLAHCFKFLGDILPNPGYTFEFFLHFRLVQYFWNRCFKQPHFCRRCKAFLLHQDDELACIENTPHQELDGLICWEMRKTIIRISISQLI